MKHHFSLLSSILLVGTLSIVISIIYALFRNGLAMHDRNHQLFIAQNEVENHVYALNQLNTNDWNVLTEQQILTKPETECSYTTQMTTYGTQKLVIDCLVIPIGNHNLQFQIEKFTE